MSDHPLEPPKTLVIVLCLLKRTAFAGKTRQALRFPLVSRTTLLPPVPLTVYPTVLPSPLIIPHGAEMFPTFLRTLLTTVVGPLECGPLDAIM